jgi:hypothetical protein
MVVEPIAVMPGDDAAAEEGWFSGTHLGTYHGLPPTGRSVRVRVCDIYLFDDDRLICERVYYDLLTVLHDLGRAHAPNSAPARLTVLVSHPIHPTRTFRREPLRRRP